MSKTKARFKLAFEHVANTNPSDKQKLRLYGLYKTVRTGSVDRSRPGAFQLVARAKWDAWKAAESLSKDAAMLQVGRRRPLVSLLVPSRSFSFLLVPAR